MGWNGREFGIRDIFFSLFLPYWTMRAFFTFFFFFFAETNAQNPFLFSPGKNSWGGGCMVVR